MEIRKTNGKNSCLKSGFEATQLTGRLDTHLPISVLVLDNRSNQSANLLLIENGFDDITC